MIGHSIRIDDIQIGERHRALADEAVDRLVASIREAGLINPISVRIVDEMEVDGDLTAGVPVLVAGRHRLEAVKRLGWSHVDCIEIDDDQLKAEMWEIAENLHRLDLTKDQRDEHIRRYAELLEAKRLLPQNAAPVSTLSDGRRAGPQHEKAVPRQIAEETGLSVDTVRRALNPKPADIKSVIESESDEEAIIREANAIVSAWNRARQAARDLALEQIDEPVFDRSRAAGAFA
jgi:ParB/RepB/Spo0J family partition protein